MLRRLFVEEKDDVHAGNRYLKNGCSHFLFHYLSVGLVHLINLLIRYQMILG